MGIAMMVVGAYWQISRSDYIELLPTDEFFTVTALLIASGTIVIVLCLFGFIGVWMQSQCIILIVSLVYIISRRKRILINIYMESFYKLFTVPKNCHLTIITQICWIKIYCNIYMYCYRWLWLTVGYKLSIPHIVRTFLALPAVPEMWFHVPVYAVCSCDPRPVHRRRYCGLHLPRGGNANILILLHLYGYYFI